MRKKNEIYVGAKGKESLFDLAIPATFSGKVVLFVHGYMGLKDWGCWNLVEDYFLELGFGFCKYNVSHNGCSINDPINFVDLDSFSMNTYSNECQDFNCILDEITQQKQGIDDVFVIGHSRGGGVALLTSGHKLVKKVSTWAAISDISSRFPKGAAFDDWKSSGYYHKKNGRTLQEMPHHFSQYLDFIENENELNIENKTKETKKPLLIIHGDSDKSVLPSEGEKLAKWSGTELKLIAGAAHTFDSSHPWTEEVLPNRLEEVCRLTAAFFLSSKHD